MNILSSILLAVGFVIVMFIPVILLIWASLKLFKSANQTPLVLLSIGAILLGVASLDFLATFFTAFSHDAEALARYAVYASFAGGIFRYVGMLCIGIGLLRFAYTNAPAR